MECPISNTNIIKIHHRPTGFSLSVPPSLEQIKMRNYNRSTLLIVSYTRNYNKKETNNGTANN